MGPARVEAPPQRHHKPQDAGRRNGEAPVFRKLIASAGRAEGIAAADLIAAVTSTGLDGEAVRNVRVLERFTLLEVPAADVDRVVQAIAGTSVRGHALELEPARS